jgi:hypothetical protein
MKKDVKTVLPDSPYLGMIDSSKTNKSHHHHAAVKRYSVWH